MRRLRFGAHLPARRTQCRKVSKRAASIHGRALWAILSPASESKRNQRDRGNA